MGYPSKQCLLNRSGILCGQCAEGLSLMLGSNQCGQCTNDYIALIIPFAVAGIALTAFVIVLNLTVSVGTINGLIFYANIVKIYEAIFFPNGSIPILSQFISWLNLDLGIETCFFDGMNSCSKTWLQFIFICYVWFLLMLVIILSKYSSKVVWLVGLDYIFTTSSCCLSTSYVSRYLGYSTVGCVNISLSSYCSHVFFLRRVYWHVPLFCLELSFIINLLFLVHINLQTSENSKS